MKACPTCDRTYADDSLTFCLVDGSVLSAPYDPNATLHMPDVRTTDGGATAPPPQTTIVALQPPKLYSDRQPIPPSTKQRSNTTLLVVIAVSVIVVVVLGVGVFAALRWSGNSETPLRRPNGNIAVASPTATPRIEVTDPWERHEDTSINEGERITFYPVTTQQQCEDDCLRDSRCKAYTIIRAGAYNASDPQMCYLMAEIKTLNPSTCCFSALKR